jgi:FixJ family two-component response regulator
MGFRVSSYPRPELAFQAFLQEPTGFQVLVTDQAMPGMSGAELADAIWAVNPTFPIILLSGDPEHGLTTASTGKPGFIACLAKPMAPRDLARAILQSLPAMNRHTQTGPP